MTTTMDTDSESQDSDDGRRFRFEATRKDSSTALQARKRNTASSPPPSSYSQPPRDNLRRSRSRDRSRYDRKDDRRQEYRSNNYDDNNRRNQKEQRNRDDEQRKKDDNYRYRDNKNYSSSKDSRESSNRDSRELLNRDTRDITNRDSRSRDLRESKYSRDDKRKRSRERNYDLKNRDKYRRYSRERERTNRDQIRQDEQQKIKETTSNKEYIRVNEKNKNQGNQDCKDLNLSDFDIVSDTEELTSDNLNIKTTIKTSRGEFKERINSEETDKVINSPPQNGDHVNDIDIDINDNDDDDDDDDNNNNHDDDDDKKFPNLDNSNNHDISDFLLASTSAKSSCSYNENNDDNNDNDDDNNRLINNKNKNCTEVNKKLDISKNYNNADDDDNDDSYGPILPPNINEKIPEKKIIGPYLPECFKKQIEENISKNNDDDDDDEKEEEEEDTFGPALPPHLASKNCEALVQELPVKMDISDSVKDVKNYEEDDEDDDGCIGPLPVNHPALQDDLVQQQLEYRARMIKRELAEIDNNVDEKKREEWMTELPAVQTAHLGLVPRSFRSRPGPDMSDRSSWTDTPADRAKKQREKILMIGNTSKDKEPIEHEIIEKPNKRKEKTLMEMHQKKLHKKKKKEEKEAKEAGLTMRRPFDRDIDMQVNRFDESRNKTILRKAASLDDRFSRGKM